METLNISLPKKLSLKVDEMIEREDYASRSEFFRSLLRLYLQLTENKSTARIPFFIPFKKQPLSQVKRELKKTKLYKKIYR